jgi:Htaa
VKLHSRTLAIKFTASAFAALTKSTTGAFADNRTVTPVAPATASSRLFKFSLGGGKVNVHKLTGKVSSKGGINFQSVSTLPIIGPSTTQFELTSFALHFGGPSAVLVATFVGSSTTPSAQLATLSTSHAKHSAHGHKVSISGVTLKLTSDGAQVFNSQNHAFKVGETIGTASVTATT